MNPNTSIVVSFYNKIDLLKIILASLNNQFDGSFNVIIADDGSKKEVTDEIEKIKSGYPFEIFHLWQEDKGFRKNRILNQAVLKSHPYIIFIDGDCIPQEHFVKDHIENALPGQCLNGRRADLSPTVSQLVSVNHPESFFKRNVKKIISDYLLGRGKNIEKGFRITNSLIFDFLNRKDKGLLGCNFSLYKDDIVAINGFDERYEAAGVGEDTDIEFRLRLNGIKIKNIFFKANQIHIYHKELTRNSVNYDIFKQVMRDKNAFTPFGITKKSES